MTPVLLDLPKQVHLDIMAHLLPTPPDNERGAFAFATSERKGDAHVFRYREWFPLGPADLERSSPYYLELTDAARSRVIKRAHDLGATIVELHSHLGPWPAAFSESDRIGFEEFVPHVWWRLRGRGYLAVVVTDSGFDALVWRTGPRSPEVLTAIRAGGELLRPTALTLDRWRLDSDA